ncbi:tetratricopeptide repeat protein [Rhodobacteraceae bacterium]|nr:tetratricopeptide repeat protein [Paracoccaceae bacterium]
MRIALFPSVLALAVGLTTAVPGVARDSGSYLAGRSAMITSDYDAAAQYYSRALVRDPSNLSILENAATAYLGLGDLDRAAQVAERFYEASGNSQLSSMILLGNAAKNDDWDRVLANLDAGQTVGPLFDDLARAWALVGAGRMTDALTAFDDVASNEGVEAFGMYHKALALASVGDLEGSAEIFAGDSGTTLRLTRRGVVAYSEVLSQLDRNADAMDLIEKSFGTSLDPQLERLSELLEAGDTVPFKSIERPTDGLAEVYYSIATALRSEAQAAYTLLYARMAMGLRPDHTDALLLAAELLEELERYELATEVYDSVPADHPSFHAAEMGRADALRQSGREDEAIEVLQQLTETHGDLPLVQVTLADALRDQERFEEANSVYDTAIDLIEVENQTHWIIYFARGITFERLDNWEAAEADFLKALELRPDQPQVLNYLGYTMLEKQINMNEALTLIERAVEQRPDSGYIIDSLGWGLYRLGRYEEAVGHMEKAVAREPIDPIVNDHLGDVYWAVGRVREAEFQWHRALSFVTDDTNLNDVKPDRIRRKLEVGLDQVLSEEGAPPLRVANDDG